MRRLKNLHYFCSLSVRKMAREYPRSTSCFFGISGQHIYWVSWHGLWTSHWVSAVLGVRSNFMVRWIARYYAKRASCECQACLPAYAQSVHRLTPSLSLWLWQPAGEQQTTSESAQNKPLSPPQVAFGCGWFECTLPRQCSLPIFCCVLLLSVWQQPESSTDALMVVPLALLKLKSYAGG